MREPIQVKPIGNEYGLETERSHSDIYELSYVAGLRITVITSPRGSLQNLWLEHYFSRPIAFRLLDEGDMLRWWNSGQFKSDHHLYEVTKGGWLTEDTFEDTLTGISSFENKVAEWLIVSQEASVSVISTEPPLIRELLQR